jgi:hypothetical protein
MPAPDVCKVLGAKIPVKGQEMLWVAQCVCVCSLAVITLIILAVQSAFLWRMGPRVASVAPLKRIPNGWQRH